MYAFKEAGSLLLFRGGSAVAVGSVCKPQVASEVRERPTHLHNHGEQHMHLLKRDASPAGADAVCATFAVFHLPGVERDEQKAQPLSPGSRTSIRPGLIRPQFSIFCFPRRHFDRQT